MNKPTRLIPSLWILAGIAFILIGVSYFWLTPYLLLEKSKPLSAYPAFPALQQSDRITVIAPHLDDETLGAGGFIAEARKEHIPVSIIFMTNGDDFPLGANLEFKTGYPSPSQLAQFGIRRQQEAIKAVGKLGVDANDLYFLGLPDRGLAQLLLPKYKSTPYTSPGTLLNKSTYPLTYVPNLPYTGDSAIQALTDTINKTNPTQIMTTSVQDRHTDHAATARFAQQILPSITSKPKLSHFLIHYTNYPWPKGIDQQADLLPPPKLSDTVTTWQSFGLSDDIIKQKSDAIDEYKTQLRVPQVNLLLRSMVRKNELFF